MTDAWFVDTNVPVYAVDVSHAVKQARALDWMRFLWHTRAGRVSFQVLQEYYVTVTRKLNPGRSPASARADVRALAAWDPLPIDIAAIESAWLIQDRFGLSWWDALIVSAAQLSGCKWLLTEDLQTGQDFGGVRVVNPFTQAPPP